MVEKDPYGDNTVEIELEKIKLSLGINKPNSEGSPMSIISYCVQAN